MITLLPSLFEHPMTEKEKLLLAQMQVENLLVLLKNNPYENYMCGKLYGVKYELQRQLSLNK